MCNLLMTKVNSLENSMPKVSAAIANEANLLLNTNVPPSTKKNNHSNTRSSCPTAPHGSKVILYLSDDDEDDFNLQKAKKSEDVSSTPQVTPVISHLQKTTKPTNMANLFPKYSDYRRENTTNFNVYWYFNSMFPSLCS